MKSPPPSPSGTANGFPSLRDIMLYLSAYEVKPTDRNDPERILPTPKGRIFDPFGVGNLILAFPYP
jgi:hypothetical protein